MPPARIAGQDTAERLASSATAGPTTVSAMTFLHMWGFDTGNVAAEEFVPSRAPEARSVISMTAADPAGAALSTIAVAAPVPR